MGLISSAGHALGFGQADAVKPQMADTNAFYYGGGGNSNYFNQSRDMLQNQATGAQGRDAPALGFGGFDANNTNAANARSQQQGLAQSYQGVLNGTAPSVAQQQMQQGFQQAQQGQALAAANARGPNELSAQRDAAFGQAGLGAQAAAQGGLLRAQEMDAARGGLGNVLGTMRGQDYGAAGQALQQQGLVSQNALGQRGLNDQYGLGMQGYVQQQNQAQLGASTGLALADQAAQNSANQQNQQAQNDEINRGSAFRGQVFGAAAAAAGAAA